MIHNKSCDQKGQQKVFNLFLNTTGSCCKSYQVELDVSKKISEYIDHWQSEKNQMDQGIEVASCEYCWAKEKQGLLSLRQHHQPAYNLIEIYSSNLCNQMCSYCNPKFSSVWQDSVKTHGIFKSVSKSTKDNQKIFLDSVSNEYWLQQILDYIQQQQDNSISVKLLGGEPLMQSKNLQKLLELDSKKIKELSVHTNLNPPSNRFLVWMLDNFPKSKLKFFISLDATPGLNSIPRAGFDQGRFNSNLELLEKNQIEFSFVSVVSILSIFDVVNFSNWLEKKQYKTIFGRITSPDCLNPVYLPAEFKQLIVDHSQNLPQEIQIILSDFNPSVDIKLFEQYNYLNQYFARTGIDPIRTGLPNFEEYWKWLSSKKFNKRLST